MNIEKIIDLLSDYQEALESIEMFNVPDEEMYQCIIDKNKIEKKLKKKLIKLIVSM